MAIADGASLGVYGIMFQLPCAAGPWLIEAPDGYVKPNRTTLMIQFANLRLPIALNRAGMVPKWHESTQELTRCDRASGEGLPYLQDRRDRSGRRMLLVS